MADEPASLTATVEKGVVERIRSMGFAEFVLVGILAAVVYGIPWMADRIESSATKMETAHREERTQAEATHAKTIEGLTKTFESTLDRLERRVKAREAGAEVGHAAAPGPEPGPPGTAGNE